MISSVFCLVCVQLSSSFLTNSTELRCSASLEILLSWGLEASFTRPHHWTLSWGQWMQFRPSRYWFKMGLVLVFTTYVPLHYLVGICRDFCLFKTFSDPVHASELRPQSHRRQINGSVIWGGGDVFRLAQHEADAACAVYYQKKLCDNRCRITAWGWVVSRLIISSSRRKRSLTLNPLNTELNPICQ